MRDRPGITGAATGGVDCTITAYQPDASAALSPSPRFPNWWTDDPSPALAEGVHHGVKTVNEWRVDYLRDFAARIERCRTPARQ